MQFTKNWRFFAGIDPRSVAYVEPNFSELLRNSLQLKGVFAKDLHCRLGLNTPWQVVSKSVQAPF